MPPPLPQRRAAYWTYSIDGSGNMTSTVTDLQAAISLPGSSEALAVNNSGQMVGLCNGTATSELGTISNDVWFYHFGDASYTDLTTLAGLYENRTGGKAEVLCRQPDQQRRTGCGRGQCRHYGRPVYNAAIWDSANGLRDLNTAFSAYLAAWSAVNGGATVVAQRRRHRQSTTRT